MFLALFGELCLFGVLEDAFLSVNYPCDHSVWFGDGDVSVFFEFVEAVVDFAVG